MDGGGGRTVGIDFAHGGMLYHRYVGTVILGQRACLLNLGRAGVVRIGSWWYFIVFPRQDLYFRGGPLPHIEAWILSNTIHSGFCTMV